MNVAKRTRKPIKACPHCGYAECPECGQPLEVKPLPDVPYYPGGAGPFLIWVVPYWQQYYPAPATYPQWWNGYQVSSGSISGRLPDGITVQVIN